MPFGRNVYRERIAQKLTQEDLASVAGISRTMLSKIERAEVTPSLTIAVNIANSLGCTIATMLDDTSVGSIISYVPKGNRTKVKCPITDEKKEVLSPFLENGIQIHFATLHPGKTSGKLPPHAKGTKEYLILHQGEIKLVLPDVTTTIYAGDCIVYRGDVEHEVVNCGDVDALVYIITDAAWVQHRNID